MHNETIMLQRDVEAIQIPSGDTVFLPVATQVNILQTLGGSYTIATDYGIVRIQAKDVDALGIHPDSIKSSANDLLSDAPLEEQVWNQLKQVYDPEIPVDIVNLGLVYDCVISDIEGGSDVQVKMTLTAPGCGMGPTIAADARGRILSLPGVVSAEVDIVWDPPWNQDMISEEGKMQLGLM